MSAGVPEVLFLVPPQYLSRCINKVGNIVQLILPRFRILMRFHYRPRHYAYIELFCQLLIFVQILVPLPAEREELRVFGHPIGEMVFGENGEVGAFGSGGSYELGGSGEVVGGVERLRGRGSVGGREDESSLMEMEDLGVELNDGDLVVWRHGEGLCQLMGIKPGRDAAIQTWRARRGC